MRNRWTIVWIIVGLLFVAPPAVLFYRQHRQQQAELASQARMLDEPPISVPANAGELLPASNKTGLVVPLAKTGTVKGVILSPDGRKALLTGEDGILRLMEVRTGKEIKSASQGGQPWSGCISPDGRTAVLRNYNGIVVCDLSSMQYTASMYANDGGGQISCAAFAPNGLTALTGGADGAVHVWNLKTQQLLGRLSLEHDQVLAVAYSADGKRVLAAGHSGMIRAWDIKTGQVLRQSNKQDYVVGSAAFSADGRRAVLGSTSQKAGVIDTDAMAELSHMDGDATRVAITRDGTRVLTSTGAQMHLWDAATGRKLATLDVPDLPAQDIAALLPDGRHIIVGGKAPGVYSMLGADEKK